MSKDLRQDIQSALQAFNHKPLAEAAYHFWKILGYESQRRYEQVTYSYSEFKAGFSSNYQIRDEKAQGELWKEISILFQLTDDEINQQLSNSAQQEIPGLGFRTIQTNNIKSYLFAAVDLKAQKLNRTVLAKLTREVNRCFAMPVLLLIRTGGSLHLTVIYRRRNKKDDSRDVLEKVTMIKDIGCGTDIHRAHIEILHDLNLTELSSRHIISNFDQLHRAWEQTLDLKELNKRFYKELSNWFFWAVRQVDFPDPSEPNPDIRNTIGLIRMLTRIIFVWFMKEKNLVPETLFDKAKVQTIIRFTDPSGSSYYKAILQNLFFATLNTKMIKDSADSRRFRAPIKGYVNSDFANHTVFRYEPLFLKPDTAIQDHFGSIPYLNGSLFECLDIEIKENGRVTKTFVDGFSDRKYNPLKVPDQLFWLQEEVDYDLNDTYGTKNQHFQIKGLLDILHSYKFTIAENTPVEEEVALDPELLGRVFENLLAAYNPETRSTARKETGSFYTPREIVDFMVNESIIAHLCKALPANDDKAAEDNELRLRLLMTYADEDSLFSSDEADLLIDAINATRIIDPACGSGAFPMGLLLKMVYLLHKLDPDNQKWKARQLANLKNSLQELPKTIADTRIRAETAARLQNDIQEIEKTFQDYDLDYSRKLYLIERCIYGVDIQPIAVQISHLRFFISLLVDQNPKADQENLGIQSLPNLETNLIAANSLIPINLGEQTDVFFHNEVEAYKSAILDIHNEYFSARTRSQKKELREREARVRQEFVANLKELNALDDLSRAIASWSPYQNNTHAAFFDPGIMFGFKTFDIVIANPPYIRQEEINYKTDLQHAGYQVFCGTADLYTYFYELAYKLLSENGIVTYITSNKWMKANYGANLRSLLSGRTCISLLVDFGAFKVFESATVDTNIIIYRKQIPEKAYHLRYVNVDGTFAGLNLDDYIQIKQDLLKQSTLSGAGWTIADRSVLELKEKIESAGKPLKDWNVKIFYGIKTGLKEAFIIDSEVKDSLYIHDPKSAKVIHPILRGRDIQRYSHTWADKWLITLPSGWTNDNRGSTDPLAYFSSHYPTIYSHFLRVGELRTRGKGLYNRDDQGDYWWELRDCTYYQEFEKAKIIWADIASGSCFQYDDQGFYLENTAYMLTGDDLGFILGVLNSRIYVFYYRLIASGLSGAANRGFKIFIEQFPIPKDMDGKAKETISNNALLLAGNKLSPQLREQIDSEINTLLYDHYGFSASEIELIEA